MRWRGGAAGNSVFGLEHSGDVVGMISADTGFDQCANDDSHHVPEKAGAFDADDQAAAELFDGAVVDGSAGVFALVAGTDKAGEVVFADEMSSRGIHRGDIQCSPAMPREIAEEDRPIVVIPDEILI